ncbi:MAG: response regulator [Oscillatoria sp. PMC 1051.18]|nr:response regulator [Oscillatoria sp. PMC 1050.18]MEC5031623.1 response regulator [Oscillatoria sp. PMC 1051.18]
MIQKKSGQQEIILIVDDNSSNIAILDEFLQLQGYQVRVAQDGESALEILERELPDLILLDVMMPGINGFETCSRLKQNPACQEIPVIFITALGDLSNKVKGFEVGGVDYITKPLQVEEILARVKTHLKIKHLQTEHSQHNQQLQTEIQRRLSVEASLREAQINLEEKVRQRTSELQNINYLLSRKISELQQTKLALQQALIAAEAASAAKSQFLSNISHELRTPLNAILGFSQILVQDITLTEKQQEYLGIINASGEHLLKLINDILSSAKIKNNQIIVQENSFNLADFVSDIATMMRVTASAKGLELKSELDDNLPGYVQTDESKLRQVLVNLLDNAIKFTDSGTVTLRVKVEDRSLQTTNSFSRLKKHFLIFDVEDTGAGISLEQKESLFEPFVQTRTNRQPSEGTGLGLSISREFVKFMQGEITVNSELGSGSVFTVAIPLKLARAADVEIKNYSKKQAIALQPNQPDYRILVADDLPVHGQLLLEILEPLGFNVKVAENGQQTLDFWRSWQPHLLLLDLQMPVLNGYQVLQKIKSATSKQQPIIIALTAKVFNEDRQKALAAGCDDFISKPFREETLLSKISEHLGVRYLYKEDLPSNLISDLSLHLTKEDLQVMSPEWIAQIYHAALLADDEQVRELIAVIPEDRSDISEALVNLVNNFRFDIVIDLIEES